MKREKMPQIVPLLLLPLVWTGLACAEEPSAVEHAPAAFEEALPDEPGTMTVRWASEYSRPRYAGGLSVSNLRAQWFIGVAEGLSGEIELPVMGVQAPGGSAWGVGRVGLGIKAAPWRSTRLPLAIRAEVELPTASSKLPEETRASTGALYVAGAVDGATWSLQGDFGYETTWSADDRALNCDLAWVRRLSSTLALHGEFVGERELVEGTTIASAGPGLSFASRSGLAVSGAVLLGLNTNSELVRLVFNVGREF